MAVDGWAVTFGTARRGLGWAAARPGPSPRCTKCKSVNADKCKKKLQFIHNLTASDTSKTAKITKGDITQQHIDIQAMCWWVISLFCDFCSFISYHINDIISYLCD